MSEKIILTCAVTGEGPLNPDHPSFPVTPKQIAAAALEAIAEGAAIVHLHVRDPRTGEGSRDPNLFREVVALIRSSGTDAIINLSAGMGGDFCPDPLDESKGGPFTDVATAEERLAHVELLRPEICTLDVTTMNVEAANDRMKNAGAAVYLNTTRTLREMAARIQRLNVRPEIEIFSPGDVMFARQLIADGLISEPSMFQFVLGVRWGAPSTPATIAYLKELLPSNATWAAFGIGRQQMPMLAQAALLGGHVRVGLEDNLYLERGVFATNGQLVARARELLGFIGKELASPNEARAILGLRQFAASGGQSG